VAGYRLHDLTRPMTRETIVALAGKLADGDPRYAEITKDPLRGWDTDNGAIFHVHIQDHFGTHVDAPLHTIRGAPSIDQVDLSRFFGEAYVADASGHTLEALGPEQFEAIAGDVREGDILLIHSLDRPGSLDAYIEQQTWVAPAGAQWLVDRGVKSVGCETWGIEHIYDGYFLKDYYNPETPQPTWPTHQILLSNDVYIIEGLTGLGALKGKRVMFAALPLPIPGGSGCPVRAVAWETLP
jgi:kynurenine formamidase